MDTLRRNLDSRMLSLLGCLLVLGACSTPQDQGQDQHRPTLTADDLLERRGAERDAALPLQTIAFGSCNRTDLPQPLWAPIRAAEPDLWIWLGDNIYADTGDMSVMRAKYEVQLAQPGYAALRSEAPIVGTWDDHDYGENGAGSEYRHREASQQEMLDFLGEPMDSPRRTRAGVYASYSYGEAPHRTKVILLDTRFHRDAPGDDGTILGEEQWAWLEAELARSDAQLNLVGGGFQFLPVDHRYDKWAEFGSERARLLELIGSTGAPGVILISGDRHISEIMRVEDPALNYPLYEVTSSGMTHSWADNPGEENPYRVGDLYTDLGFGVAAVDWAAGTVSLQLRDPGGDVAEEVTLRLEELGGA